MNVGIIGAGRMATVLGKRFVVARHNVMLSHSRQKPSSIGRRARSVRGHARAPPRMRFDWRRGDAGGGVDRNRL